MTYLKQFFKTFPVTASLVTLFIVIYLLMNLVYPFAASSNQAVFTFGGLFGELIKFSPLQGYRLLTSNLVHIGLEHLLLNSISLFSVGQIAEQIWSKKTYLTLFTLAGLFGGFLTIWLTPQVLSAGASSSIFGLFAGVALLGHFGHHHQLKKLGKSFQAIILINLLSNLLMPQVNIWGHLGGAIGGALCAVFLPNQLGLAIFSTHQKKMALLAYLGLSALILTGFYVF